MQIYNLNTLLTILKDHWKWRKKIGRLSVYELKKKSRGAVLGWAWFFIKPAVYIFCFWFALEIGLRAGSSQNSNVPYILWLTAGMIPWFFMQEMLSAGINTLNAHKYLVNKIKFPLCAISTITACSAFIIQLILQAVLIIIYLVCGQPFDVHLLQIPILLALLFLFWDIASILFSHLTALSKDFKNMMNALRTPFFWLSGVIFNVNNVPIDWIQVILYFNPITFLVTSFRGAFCDKTWFWENPYALGGFVVVFIATLILMVLVYKRISPEVPDVI